ncbi:nucleotidyltransferase family protein [Lysobacter fragariae]
MLDAFASAGHEAYVCGGAVRDALAGDDINDVDIAVGAALPRIREVTAQLLGEDSTSAYLPRFGVLKVGPDGHGIDIAMLRTPDDVSDARTLSEVVYSRIGTLEQDARNRDLTINCGFWSHRHGFIDPLGCTERHILEREFEISADTRKVAIDPRLSFRCLLFQARGYRMRPDARRHITARLGPDMLSFADGLHDYLHTLVRGSTDTAAAICRAADGLVEPEVAAQLAEACAHVGRK